MVFSPTSPGLSELNLQAEAEDNETGTHQALLSVSCASVKSRPASTKDAEAGSSLLPCTELASTQSLMDLPTEGEKLEHYTRTRPRPNRRNKQPPSKPNVRPISFFNQAGLIFVMGKYLHQHLFQPWKIKHTEQQLVYYAVISCA